ncbi:von Willebrand factor D and EGF domain-containing protein-like [Stylophora pistillata]|uniref:von Willebrand factor D and EGF domain-containing protein-like n=1 Tax=Stylophora pistillata TaxID=50429 RepID=UPI000C042A0B|nr:von Willebrand factor D and EGF domain-containing protein-like [Stylophora pistillata]
MPLPLLFAMKFLAIAFLPTPSDGSADPCDSYSTLNDPYRSTGYVATPGKDPMICDNQLSTGWYRFTNSVGGKMPETKISKYQCGTYAPIWMMPPHPATADGVVDRTACVNFNEMNSGCLQLAIKVKNCNNSYFVYHLTATFGCPMAFCAGTAKPCPRGQTGLFPNCTVWIKKDFPFAEIPVPNISYVALQSGEFTDEKPKLNCSFNFSTRKNVSFYIQWFISGEVVLNETICESPEDSCNLRYSLLFQSKYSLGDTLRCDLWAKYNTHPDNIWTNPVSSQLFFAGIEIEPAELSVTQCDVGNVLHRIQLKPNLPIRQGSIKVKFGTKDFFQDVLMNTCELTLVLGDEQQWHNISVQVACDNTNEPLAPSAFTFTVADTVSVLNAFWLKYELPSVLITKVENPVKICWATGDPHYYTFDKRYYDFYRPGDFVLYQSKYRNFEVHTRLWHCGRTVTCNCGVAIRELRDVIVLSSCTEDLQYNYGMPMKVEITSPGRLMRGTKILVGQRGGYTEYVVRLPSGTVVRIKRYSWGNNVEMEAPQFDEGKTLGMCGNFDGDPNNDFEQGGDKQSYGDADSFGESWRVNKSTSLFNVVPPCNDAMCDSTESQLNMDRCTCQKNSLGDDINVNCSLEIMSFNGLPGSEYEDRTNAAEDAARKKRDLAYSDDIIYLYDNEKSSPSVFRKREKRAIHTDLSLENATEYCRKRVLETTAAKICVELTGVNASSAIEACAADLHLTGDFEWVESAFESLKSSCAFEAVSNFSAYEKDEEGNFVPPMKIAQNLCPGNCNSNGNCINGTCVCNEGFISADCSLRFDEIPRLFRYEKSLPQLCSTADDAFDVRESIR